MRIFTKLFIMLACAMCVVACNEPPIIDEPSTELAVKLETKELTIDGNGGEQSIGYTIENGINGIDIALESDATWLENLRTESSQILFTCDKNFTNKERNANIAVRYPNLNMQIIKVTQQANDAVTFNIEVSDIKSTSCTTSITPSDPEIPYIVYMSEVSYFLAAGITNEKELFQDDYNTYTKWAEDNGSTNLEKFMFLNQFAFAGDANISWTGMVPDREYVIYAYAIEFSEDGQDYSLASAVWHDTIILPTHVFADIEFDVNITVDGPKATYEFSPVDWEGKYFIDIYAEGDYMYRAEGETPDEAYCKQVANDWISTITIYMQSGYSAEQLMELMCLQGPDSYSEIKKSNTKYCMVFYGIEMVDGLPQVTTRPYLAHFQTEEVKPSDMQIDIRVENCYVRVADIYITPTTQDEPYVATFLKKSDVPYTENKDIIKWLLGYDLSGNTYRGSIETTIIGLEPNTEYLALAFGYYGGVVTTDLFSYEFKTEEEGVCENEVLGVNITAPYSLKELEAAMPDTYYNYGQFENMGWYAMCAEIQTANNEGRVFMNTYKASYLVTANMEEIKADVCSYDTPRSCLFVGEDDVLYIMCAVAMDYKGNLSEMYVSEPFSYSLTNESCRDVNELLDKLGLEPEVQAEPAIKILNLKR